MRDQVRLFWTIRVMDIIFFFHFTRFCGSNVITSSHVTPIHVLSIYDIVMWFKRKISNVWRSVIPRLNTCSYMDENGVSRLFTCSWIYASNMNSLPATVQKIRDLAARKTEDKNINPFTAWYIFTALVIFTYYDV